MSFSQKMLRTLLVGIAFWIIWGVWQTVSVQLPENLTQITTPAELAALAPGQEFLIEGTVAPATPPPYHTWQGRFTFLHMERRDLSSGSGKHQVIVVAEDHRPAGVFLWAGRPLILSANTYHLNFAPRIQPRFWPRKWLLTAPVDNWDSSSRGFIPNSPAFALGKINPSGQPQIEALLGSPLESVAADLDWQNTIRLRLTLAAKIVLSIFVLSFLSPLWKGAASDKNPSEPECDLR